MPSTPPVSRMPWEGESQLQSGRIDEERRSRICLHLEGQGFPNLDSRSEGKSDPFCIVEMRDKNKPSTFRRVVQTETVFNNLNPKWATRVELDFDFGTAQVLRFLVYDRDENGDDLSKQDFIGEASCTVAQILLADRQRHVLHLTNAKAKLLQRCGKLIIRAEEQKPDFGDLLTLQIACSHLRNTSKPFFVLCRSTNDDAFVPVRYSEVCKTAQSSSRGYQFAPFSTSLAKLCNGDKNRRLRIEFYDFHRRGKHTSCGSYVFTIAQIENDFQECRRRASNTKFVPPTYNIMRYRSYGSSIHSGKLTVLQCAMSSSVTFLDYIGNGGVVFSTVFGVDMSSTNGDPADQSSLHYNNPTGLNEYENAIREVGSVLAQYDSTQTFAAWGFSACLPPAFSEFSNCFPLSGNPSGICSHIDGVVAAYRSMLCKVAPHRPCRYNGVLQKVIGQVRDEDRRTRHGVYTILVLVTDGDFCDFDEVSDSICAAAELPLSIVIVGIGPAEMPLLERLDGDETRLCDSAGIPASRDIVQFVPFQRHRGNPAKLAQEVLAEIPDQFVSFFRSKGIRPVDKRPSSSTSNFPIIPQKFAGHSQQEDEDAESTDDMYGNNNEGPALQSSAHSSAHSFERMSSVGSNSRNFPPSASHSNASLSSSSSDAHIHPIYPPGSPGPLSMKIQSNYPIASSSGMNHYVPLQNVVPTNSMSRPTSQPWTPNIPAFVSGPQLHGSNVAQQYQLPTSGHLYANTPTNTHNVQQSFPPFVQEQYASHHNVSHDFMSHPENATAENGVDVPNVVHLSLSEAQLVQPDLSPLPQQDIPPPPLDYNATPSAYEDNAELLHSSGQSSFCSRPQIYMQPVPNVSAAPLPTSGAPGFHPYLATQHSSHPNHQQSVPSSNVPPPAQIRIAMQHQQQYANADVQNVPTHQYRQHLRQQQQQSAPLSQHVWAPSKK